MDREKDIEMLKIKIKENILNVNLDLIDDYKRERLLEDGFYKCKYDLSDINKFLIDYSSFDFDNDSLLKLLGSNRFLELLQKNDELYLLKPLFLYLLDCDDIKDKVYDMYNVNYKNYI